MKKIFLVLILLLGTVFAADQVRVMDRTGHEVNPGSSNRWPVSHLNAGTAGVKMLRSAPGNTNSHFVTGMAMTGGAAADGFHFLRQDCVLFDRNEESLSMADDGDDYDWGDQAADGDFTAEFWINLPATTSGIGSLMKRGNEASDGWLIELTSGSFVKFTAHDSSDSATITAVSTAVDDGEWHHVLVQVDRDSTTGMQIYVDGEPDAVAVDPTDLALTLDGGSTIVTTGVDGVTFYVSSMGIYTGTASGALTVAEIKARYNSGVGAKFEGDETGLQTGFNVDEGISTSCHDIKNDASNVTTLSGATWSPSRQNGATAEVNVSGIPVSEQDMARAVGKFQCGIGTNFGGVFIDFPHPVKIGRNCPLNILETDGNFDLVLFGYTAPVR